jgi:hypothetical protein
VCCKGNRDRSFTIETSGYQIGSENVAIGPTDIAQLGIVLARVSRGDIVTVFFAENDFHQVHQILEFIAGALTLVVVKAPYHFRGANIWKYFLGWDIPFCSSFTYDAFVTIVEVAHYYTPEGWEPIIIVCFGVHSFSSNSHSFLAKHRFPNASSLTPHNTGLRSFFWQKDGQGRAEVSVKAIDRKARMLLRFYSFLGYYWLLLAIEVCWKFVLIL